MLMVVILGLAVALVVMLSTVTVAFWDAAFRGSGSACASPRIRLRKASSAEGLQNTNCPSCRNHKIAVTPPEALAIVAQMWRTLPSSEVQRVHKLSVANAQRAKGLDGAQYEAAQIECPLLARDGSCAAYAARPLHCRGWCFSSGENGDRCLLEDSGAEDGIVQGLNAAGLEGGLYELNSALATALSTPDAASRWAKGQEVFASCER